MTPANNNLIELVFDDAEKLMEVGFGSFCTLEEYRVIPVVQSAVVKDEHNVVYKVSEAYVRERCQLLLNRRQVCAYNTPSILITAFKDHVSLLFSICYSKKKAQIQFLECGLVVSKQ
jgi:hypothetical protein